MCARPTAETDRARAARFAHIQGLVHDNAPSHNSLLIRQFLAKKNVVMLHHPPYLAPADYFLFPRLKIHLKDHRFDDMSAIQKAVTHGLKAIPVSGFAHTLDWLADRTQRCVDAGGVYIE